MRSVRKAGTLVPYCSSLDGRGKENGIHGGSITDIGYHHSRGNDAADARITFTSSTKSVDGDSHSAKLIHLRSQLVVVQIYATTPRTEKHRTLPPEPLNLMGFQLPAYDVFNMTLADVPEVTVMRPYFPY